MRILVSRTTRTRGINLLVDQVEDFLLVMTGITVLDLVNGKVQHAATHGFIDEPG
ncbi:MAG: hypothetical protein OXF39_03940 [Nitrospira sp.]|nr:hypothetical protein [Nitrospira sp.]